MSPDSAAHEALPVRDRVIVLGTIGALVALSWVYLVLAPMPMPLSSGGLRSPAYLALTFVMWSVMMVGMMTPTVTPTVLTFAVVNRKVSEASRRRRLPAFIGGYLLVWLAFSALATVLQVELIEAGLIDDMGVASGSAAAAVLLAIVGVYQLLPAKRACLRHCQSPVEFLVRHYRQGISGALAMGMRHGAFCLGCCWALMLLLFVGGVMNLLWVAGIAALVLAEKLTVRGEWLRRAIGGAALLGAAIVAAAGIAL